MQLSLANSSLPVVGLKGVFTNARIRKGEYALVTDPISVKGHDLLGGVGQGFDGRGTNTLSRWDPIFDMDLNSPTPKGDFIAEQHRKLARLVQRQPIRRPLVLFSLERFLALRHTWTSDRHLTMFMPHIPSVDIVLPASSLQLTQNCAQDDADSVASSHVSPRTRRHFNRADSAALDIHGMSQQKFLQKDAADGNTSDLLFEVNDPFVCPMPDPDDVANPKYWKSIKNWLANYGQSVATSRNALLNKAGGTSLLTPNVQLVKIAGQNSMEDGDMMPSLGRFNSNDGDESSRYALMALRDIPADTELFLSYGADWWRQRLLSTLLLSAETPSEMGSVRWIERLCAADGQQDDTFPHIVLEKVNVRGGNGRGCRRTVLWDALRQERAPTQAVIAYVIRQSCIDARFAGEVLSVFGGDQCVTVLPALRRLVRRYLADQERK